MQREFLTLKDWKVTVEEIRVCCMHEFSKLSNSVDQGMNLREHYCV